MNDQLKNQNVRGWEHVQLMADSEHITRHLSWGNHAIAKMVVLAALDRMTSWTEAEQLMKQAPVHFFGQFETLLYQEMARMLKEQGRVDPTALEQVTEEFTIRAYGGPPGEDEDIVFDYHLSLRQILAINPTPQQLQDALAMLQRRYAWRETGQEQPPQES